MPVNNQVAHNTVDDCGEGVRASGTIGTTILHNRFRNIKDTGTGSVILVFTATHPGYMLAMGSQNTLIEGNDIDTALGSVKRHIEVRNGINDLDQSGSDMTGITIRKNRIKLRNVSSPFQLRGHNTGNAKIKHVVIEENEIDYTDMLVGESESRPATFLFFREVEHIETRNNKIKGTTGVAYQYNHQSSGVVIRDITHEGDVFDEIEREVVDMFSISDTQTENMTVKRVKCLKTSTQSGRPFKLANLYGGVIRNNVFKSTRSINEFMVTGSEGERIVIEYNDLTNMGNIVSSLDDIIIRRNKGHKTDNKGSVTLSSASQFIPHGLARTPRKVTVTPRQSLGNASFYYVSTIDGTNIRLQLDTAPGQDVNFDWTAEF